MTDPYETLGLNQSASLDDIKKAYRRLAKKYHPDLNPGNKEAEVKFKKISNAFELIGTPENKEKWDKGETTEQQQEKYDEFINRKKQRSTHRSSYYRSQQDSGRYSNAFGEDFDAEDIFANYFGRARGQRGTGQSSYNRPGEDELYQLEVDFKEAALGAEKVITLPNGKSLQVKIPAGIEEGKKLKFKGLGKPGIGGGPSGDVYIEIKVKSLEGFQRADRDIITNLPISFFEALSGGEVPVQTLDGTVLLNIPAGVSSGSKLRIKGKGAGAGMSRGNQIVIVKIVMPDKVDPALKDAVKELEKSYAYDPRGKQ